MKREMKSTARLAVTAGLCTSLALGGLPLEAIAAEAVVEPVQAGTAADANVTEDSGEELTSSDPTPADDAAADEGVVESDGAGDAGDSDDAGPITDSDEGLASSDSTLADDDGSVLAAQPAAAGLIEVNGVEYETLEGALGAIPADKPATVKLLGDVAIPDGMKLEIATDVTVVLNGHTLTSNDAGDRPIYVESAGSIVIDGMAAGSAVKVANPKSYGLLEAELGADVTLRGGSYSGDTTNGCLFRVKAPAAGDSKVILEDLTVDTNYSIFKTSPDTIPSGSNFELLVKGGSYTTDGLSQIFYTDTIDRSSATFEGVTANVNGGSCVVELAGSHGVFRGCNFSVNGTNSNNYSDTAVFVGYRGKATIESGSYTSKGHGAYIGTSGGEIEVLGGTVQGDKGSIQADADGGTYAGAESVVTVAGGTIQGDLGGVTHGKATSAFIVTGGDISGDIVFKQNGKDGETSASVSGGTFDREVKDEFCAEGFAPTQNDDGSFGVKPATDTVVLVTVNGATAGFQTLEEAFGYIPAGSSATVRLAKDEDISDATAKIAVPADTEVRLDLNGHALRAANNDVLVSYGKLTISDSTDADANGTGEGVILAIKPYGQGYTSGIAAAKNGGTLVLESGLVDCASEFAPDNASKGQFGFAVVNDAADASVVINGGKVIAGWYCVSGNGNNTAHEGHIVINGGELISTSDYAIYSPQAGGVSIKGGSITGAAGAVHIQRGDLTVTGGTLVALDTGNTGSWGDGTGGSGNATVNYAGSYGSVTSKIDGGTFVAKGDAELLHAGDKFPVDVAVSGGTFNKPVSEDMLAPGFALGKPDENGNYTVTTEQSYTVNHLFEAVDSDDYVKDESLAKTETLTGTIGQDTAAKAVDVEGFTAQPVEQKTIAADGSTIVEIRYDRTRHAVSFDSKGGSAATEQTVKYGAKAAEPAKPTKEGSTFLGWYVSGTFNKFDFNTPVTEDIQLVAHWVLNTYTVTLDANGGEPIEPIEMSHGYDLAEPTATRTGYTLTGWKGADGKDVTFPVTVTGDLELTAQWELDAPKVALTADKAEPGVHAGDTVTLTANPEHALGGVTYTYQWYKGREKVDGAIEKTLKVSNRDGEYTVDVVAHDGKNASAAATSNSITLAFEKQGVVVSFAQAEVEKHASEIGDTFVNGIALQARAIGDVSYESSDNAVATVDAKTGEVTIQGVGEATITAKVAETETHEAAGASYKLTVTDHDAGTWKTVKPATCTEAGEEQRVCGVCGEVLETRAIEKLTHAAAHVPAKAATCTEDGSIEHWSCESCGKLFADAACTDEIELTDTVEKATGHELEAVAEVAATCTEPGAKAHFACAACGELFWDKDGAKPVAEGELIIPALGHDYAEIVVDPTCTEGGYTVHECQRCGDSYTDSKTEALGHAEKLVGAADATCTEDGYTGDMVCSACGEVLQKGEVVPAAGHKVGAWKVTKEPACTEVGREERTCSTCGEKESRELPALGHKLEAVAEVAATIDAAGTKAHYRCAA